MKVLKIVGGMFTIIGLVFIIVSIILYQDTKSFIGKSETAMGLIIALDRRSSSSSDSGSSTTYYPVVQFETSDGRHVEFYGGVGSNPPSYKVGDNVIVRYIPNEPHKAKIDSFFQLWFLSVLFGGLGVIFGGIGFIMIIIIIQSRRKEKWLQSNGQIVYAEFQKVILDHSIRMNGKNPYRILCQWLDTTNNTVYMFRSKSIWYNPEQYIQQKKIPVYIDPKNPKRHLVDIGFLPKSVK